jgi:hypothetical protein
MYQPLLRPDQVHALYLLKRWLRKPMTKILQEAVDEYLKRRTLNPQGEVPLHQRETN